MSISALWPYELRHGAAVDPSQGACAMQAINWLVHGKTSDAPECVDSVLRDIVTRINDELSDADRGTLLPLLPRIAGSRDESRVDGRFITGLLALVDIIFDEQHPLWPSMLHGSLAWSHPWLRDFAKNAGILYRDQGDEAMLFALGASLCAAAHQTSGVIHSRSIPVAAGVALQNYYGDAGWICIDSALDAMAIDHYGPGPALIFLEAYLNAGPQGEPWSADRVDAAVKSFQAAGGPPVPATT